MLVFVGSHFAVLPLQSQTRDLTPENISSALQEASEEVRRDSLRPAFHLSPPAGFMGDPNGGIYYGGWYHIFYLLQPFGSSPGPWYWAHARSRDLLQWEHMEDGLTPAFDLGLSGVGSGSTIINSNGEPLAFYSESRDGPMEFWQARFNSDLTGWEHSPPNPVLTLEHPGLPEFDDF